MKVTHAIPVSVVPDIQATRFFPLAMLLLCRFEIVEHLRGEGPGPVCNLVAHANVHTKRGR